MSYNAEISRTNPSCFLFLIDQSGSMSDPFGSGEAIKKKSDGVSDAINRLIREISIRCAKGEEIRDYFYIGVIGYGAHVGSAFSGVLAEKELIPISEVAKNPARIEQRTKKVDDGAGGLVDQTIRFPVWIDPVANGGTPMCRALTITLEILDQFLINYPECFPPVVIHLTDGEATDGEPAELMQAITSLKSTDGNVLLFNVHISSRSEKPIAFPHNHEGLPDQYAKMLFNTASELTPYMREIAKEYGHNLLTQAKGFTFNADLVLVIQALDIGTRAINLR